MHLAQFGDGCHLFSWRASEQFGGHFVEVKVTYKSGMRYEAEARGHKVICDQPIDGGGEDSGMTPPEFLLVSLGTCAMYYAANYLRIQKLPSDGMTLTVEAEKAMNPPRLAKFRIVIDIPGEVEERHLEGARRSAEKCLVKNSMLVTPEIELSVRAVQVVA
ncbi:MAG: OsmC family protein [Bryobacterales bacterium]|nr:OsmC family protein [Bryobacterales bacterium]